jgi:hypothetical protein
MGENVRVNKNYSNATELVKLSWLLKMGVTLQASDDRWIHFLPFFIHTSTSN